MAREDGYFKKGDPRINRTKPGPGRFPDRFRKWCAKRVMDPRTRRALRRVLRDADHPAFAAAWKSVASYAAGRPARAIEMKGKLKLEELVAGANEKK